MMSTVLYLTLIVSGASLKQTKKVVELGEDAEVRDMPGRNESFSGESVQTLGIDSTATFEVKANLQVDIKAKEAVSHDLDGKLDSNQGATAGTTAVSRSSLARSQQWSDAAQRSADESGGNGLLYSFVMLIIIGGGLAGLAALQNKKAPTDQSEALVTASSVSLGVKARAAPAPLPNGITEVDVLETFDSYDKARRGFITRDVLEGLLGPDEVAQGDAFASIGEVDKLFYHDFRKLVLRAGPVQNAVLNSASRKKGSPVELGSMNQ
jgi:hypothetical protein